MRWAEFVSNVGAVEEEANDCCCRMEMQWFAASGMVKAALLKNLTNEEEELTAIPGASRKTAQRRRMAS